VLDQKIVQKLSERRGFPSIRVEEAVGVQGSGNFKTGFEGCFGESAGFAKIYRTLWAKTGVKLAVCLQCSKR
jgi:hypothetical protein